jgi:hypothetical protein
MTNGASMNPFPLFTAMMKEEWRLHASLFGSVGFALFPIMLIVFAAAAGLMLPVFTRSVPVEVLVAACHAGFTLMGVSVGAFGLMGREVMNRRFGQASLVTYSSRSLPVSDRWIMANFFVKETVYYLGLWVVPAVAGFAIGFAVHHIPLTVAGLLLISLTLSFMTGLSLIFLLSTLFAHSAKAAIVLIALALIAVAVLFVTGNLSPASLLLPLAFFSSPSPSLLAGAVLSIVIMSTAGIWWTKVEYPSGSPRYENALLPLERRLGWMPHPHFTAKDLIDLRRSEGGLGKIVFSFLFPVAIIWLLLEVLLLFIPGLSAVIVFSLLLGAFATTIYNWLTEYEQLSTYLYLPVAAGDLLEAKLQGYALLNAIPLLLLVAGAAGFGQADLLLPALIAFCSFSAYAVAVIAYVAGLNPNVMLYHTPTLLSFIGLTVPVLIALIFVSLPNPWYVGVSIIFVPAAFMLLRKAIRRWERMDVVSF